MADGYSAVWHGDILVLSDLDAGVEVHVCPAFGNTILHFRQRVGEGMVDLLVPPDSSPTVRSGFLGGSPTLFPFPNRVRNGTFSFGGRTARMEPNDGAHRLHGLVFDRPWKVDDVGADSSGAWLWCSHALDGPDYPWPCVITMALALTGGVLYLLYEVHNTGNSPMPFGVGAHPWFPATIGGKRAETRVAVPGRATWQLDEAMLPTGRTFPVEGTHLDLRGGPPLGESAYDHVYTGLVRDRSHASVATIRWGELEMEVGACSQFREWVLYAPATRPVVCLEPYTCTTDAVNLEARGVDAGLKVLKPGAKWEGRLTFEARFIG